MTRLELDLHVRAFRPHHKFFARPFAPAESEVRRSDCEVCGAVLTPASNLLNSEGRVLLTRSLCPACGFFTMSAGPNAAWMRDFYSNHWDQVRGHAEIQHRSGANPIPLQYLRKLTDRKDLKILDVGAGYGTSLRAFAEAGYKGLNAIEHSEKRAAYVAKNFDIPVSHCPLEDFPSDPVFKASGKLDFIYLWHVFEHMTDVRRNVSLLRDLLADGGHLFIAVPNFQRESFVDLSHCPLHQHSFSANNLHKLVADAGFEVLILDQGWDTHGLILVARKAARPGGLPPPPAFSRREAAQKVLRDLDLPYGYGKWNVGRPFLLKLFAERPQNSRHIEPRFSSRPVVWLERLARAVKGLPDYSMVLELDRFDPKLFEFVFETTCVKRADEDGDFPVLTVNFRHPGGSVDVWLK